MEEADVYFVDTRNADARDHRTQGRATTAVVAPRPSTVPQRVGWAGQATYAGPVYSSQPVQAAPFVPPGYGQPMYVQAPPWSYGGYGGYGPGSLGGLFAGLNGVNIGSLVDLIGQGFAAIRSLPTAPTASGDVSTDVANLTLYQTALAQHGKTDEQIRTAVHIIGKLLGA